MYLFENELKISFKNISIFQTKLLITNNFHTKQKFLNSAQMQVSVTHGTIFHFRVTAITYIYNLPPSLANKQKWYEIVLKAKIEAKFAVRNIWA